MGWFTSEESDSAKKQREDLGNQAGMSSWYADNAQGSYNALGDEATRQREYLRRIASGQDSLSAEQLRQGLQQNIATQRSMAASAAPRDAAMAARTGAMNAGRLGYGMSGQAAMAGLQERRDANNSLTQAILQQRAQDMQTALQSRQNAIGAYGAVTPEAATPSYLQQALPLINAGLGGGATVLDFIGKRQQQPGAPQPAPQTPSPVMSDRRTKTGIADADEESKSILNGLKAYRYKYKDEKHGKGSQFGIMSQDLEKAGLGHTVMDTREGKAVDTARLSTANTALIASLGRRLSKLEGASK